MHCFSLIFLLGGFFSAEAIRRIHISDDINQRIVGGESAPSGGYPSLAAVYKTTPAGTFFCGASLITDQWLLTAGQCVSDATNFTVQMATHVLTDNENDSNRKVFSTSTYVIHPDYNPTTLENDIGLIKLPESQAMSGYINIIPLPSEDFADGQNATVIGWGQLGDDDPNFSRFLKQVRVTTISNEACSQYFGSQIKDSMICTQDEGKGFCQGDSGGPLIHLVNNALQTHVGIASFVSGNGCESGDPSGYTRTYHYLDWIQSVTNTM